MKKMFCLLALVALTSAASAVSLAWDSTTITGLTTGITDIGTSMGANAPNSVVASFTVGSVNLLFATGQMIGFPGGSNGNYNNSFRVNLTNEGTLQLLIRGGSGTPQEQTVTVATGLVNGSEHKLAYSFDRTGNNGSGSTVKVYFDGDLIATTTTNRSGIDVWNGPTNGVYLPNLDAFDSLQVYNGTLTELEGKTMTTLIPEPTVLALLALGVAGLALRRKAA